MATMPPTISAPRMTEKPNSPPTACRAGRKAKDAPVRMGRPEPMRPNSGNCWSSVSMADRMSATWMMAVSCSGVKPQVEAIIIAGVMTPANDASTCCKDVGMSEPRGGNPSRLNSDLSRPASACWVLSIHVPLVRALWHAPAGADRPCPEGRPRIIP